MFEEKIANSERELHKLERELEDTDTKIQFLKKTKDDLVKPITLLQTEAEVSELM